MREALNVKLYSADKEKAIKSQTFIPSIKRYYLSIYYVLIVLDVGDVAETKTDKSPCPHRVHILAVERDDKQK